MASKKKTGGILAFLFSIITGLGTVVYYCPNILHRLRTAFHKEDSSVQTKLFDNVKAKFQKIAHEDRTPTVSITALGCDGSLTSQNQVTLVRVPTNSHAAKLSLQEGDVLEAIDGIAVDGVGTISLGLEKVGLLIPSEIIVRRSGQKIKVITRRNVLDQLILVRTEVVSDE